MGSVYPPLEQLQKEGESGRKKINEYTRYATVVLVHRPKLVLLAVVHRCRRAWCCDRFLHRRRACCFGWQIVTVLTMTAGTIFLMWLGEQIDEFGIGNGISLLIMAGILARMPGAGCELLQTGVARAGRRRQASSASKS